MIRSRAGRGLACLALLGLLSPWIFPVRAGFDGESCLATLEQPVRAGGTNGVRFVLTADLDDDGLPDVVSASFGDDQIRWFKQTRNRDDQPEFDPITITANTDGVYSIFVADLDADCDPEATEPAPCLDVISASANDNKIAWFRNNGEPKTKFGEFEISTDAGLAQAVFVADINGDCDPEHPEIPCLDVISASYRDNKIAWYENDGGEPPQFTEHLVTNEAMGASAVYAADLDDDGDMDVVSGSIVDDKVAWWEQRIEGEPPAMVFIEHVITTSGMLFDPPWEGTNPLSVIVADLNGDCDPGATTPTPCLDIAVAFNGDGAGTGKITWFVNDGNTTAPPAFRPADDDIVESLKNARQVVALDMDGDMDVDLLAAYGVDSDGDTIAWFRNGGEAEPTFTEVPVSDALGAMSVFAADLDLDPEGTIDVQSAASVAGVRIRDDEIAWYKNDPLALPPFTKDVISRNASSPESIVVEDMDADGDLDVVSASSTDDTVAWHVNDGETIEPAFTQENIDQSADGVFSVFVADLDGDCDPGAPDPAPCQDVISASPGDGTDGKIVWYQNLGPPNDPPQPDDPPLVFEDHVILERPPDDGSFVPTTGGDPDPPAESPDVKPMSVFAADVNHDCNPDAPAPCLDVIAAIRVKDEDVPDRVVWFENDHADPPGFGEGIEITTGLDGPRGIYSADLDTDGYMDVIVASTNDDKITWFRNLLGDGDSDPMWEEIVVSSVADGAQAVTVADLDDNCGSCPDGVTPPCYCLEVISASSADNKIAWYEIDAPDRTEPPVDPGSASMATGSAETGTAILTTEPTLQVEPTTLEFGDVFAGKVESATRTVMITNEAELGGETLVITSITSTATQFTPSVTALTLVPQETKPIEVTFVPSAVELFTADLEFTSNATNEPVPTVTMNGGGAQILQHIVATDRFFARFVSTGDVDDDGLIDILAASSGDGVIAAYLQQLPEVEDPQLTFEELIISPVANAARAALVADLNGDDAIDVVTAFFFEIGWHEGNFAETCNDFDADDDGRLAGAELSWIWLSWGESVPDPNDNSEWWAPVDFNYDGLIDGDDLAIGTSLGIWTRFVSPDEGEPEGPLCNFSCVSQD